MNSAGFWWPLRSSLASAIIVAATIGLPKQAGAHADLEEQIVRVTLKLAVQTNGLEASELYLHRADLFRRHAQFKEAAADLSQAALLQPDSAAVILARARLLADTRQTSEALDEVQRFLRFMPGHSEGLVLRARCHAGLNRRLEAVADFTAAIAISATPEPDLYLERARIQAALGDFASAVAGLDEGMIKLGNIPSLELPAIEYERAGANYAAALSRVDNIIARYPGREPWLALRGEILEQAGRFAEAREAFEKVLAGVAAYPPARRGLELSKDLETRASAGLTRAADKLSPSTNLPSANLHSALKSKS
ncbi:MAG: hypothetical protein U1F65_10990 [Verrucomicrobiota bacterium]